MGEEKKNYIHLSIPKSFVREYKNKQTQDSFYRVSIPKNTCIVVGNVEQVDLGGYFFTTRFRNDPIKNWNTKERDPNAKFWDIPVREDFSLLLRKMEKIGEKYEETDQIEVSPADLNIALKNGWQEYKRQKVEAEKRQEKAPSEKKKMRAKR